MNPRDQLITDFQTLREATGDATIASRLLLAEQLADLREGLRITNCLFESFAGSSADSLNTIANRPAQHKVNVTTHRGPGRPRKTPT